MEKYKFIEKITLEDIIRSELDECYKKLFLYYCYVKKYWVNLTPRQIAFGEDNIDDTNILEFLKSETVRCLPTLEEIGIIEKVKKEKTYKIGDKIKVALDCDKNDTCGGILAQCLPGIVVLLNPDSFNRWVNPSQNKNLELDAYNLTKEDIERYVLDGRYTIIEEE